MTARAPSSRQPVCPTQPHQPHRPPTWNAPRLACGTAPCAGAVSRSDSMQPIPLLMPREHPFRGLSSVRVAPGGKANRQVARATQPARELPGKPAVSGVDTGDQIIPARGSNSGRRWRLITEDYGADVPRKRWQALLRALDEGGDYLAAIIDGEDKIQLALDTLIEKLDARIAGPQAPVTDSRMPLPSPRSTAVVDAPTPSASRMLASMTPQREAAVTTSAMAARSNEAVCAVRTAVPCLAAPVDSASPMKPISLWRRMRASVSATVDRAKIKCQLAVQN